MIDETRHVRQILLPEIGARGQERISMARARVAGEGLAHEVAERYARGAGFAAVESGPIDIETLAPANIVAAPAARATLAGARAAMTAMLVAVRNERAPQ